MENEQLKQRVEWLDEERRKDKSTIASLQERVQALETSLSTSSNQIQELSGEIAQLRAMLGKIDSVETDVSKLRIETTRRMDEIEKVRKERESDQEEYRRSQMEGVHKQLADLRKELEQLGEVKKQLASLGDEDSRLNTKIDELKLALTSVEREDEEISRTLRLLEEGRRRDDKRLTDLQGETLALRKRADEQRGKLDLVADSLRKVETRLTEISLVETERREAYTTFVEKQTLAQVERDRQWKEWQARFETIEKQAMELETRIQELHTTQRDVRKAQQNVEEISERVERRINEITELQRLNEDRFRQEWATFKADDQKRWTNYTLTQEEQARDATRSQSRAMERVTALEDQVQHLDDQLSGISEQIESRLQRLLALVRDWTSEHEQLFGSTS